MAISFCCASCSFQATIVSCLQERYAKKLIYTYIGNVLLAINPFEQLPIYGAEVR